MRAQVRKKLEPILQPDTANESQEYWNQVLKSHNLSLARGQSVGHNLRYSGTSADMERAMLTDSDIENNGEEYKLKKHKPLPNRSATRNPNDLN